MNKSMSAVGWKVYLSFTVVLGILLYLSYLSLQNAKTLVVDVNSVDDTYQFMQQVQSFTSLLRDTEMANNAYILLGKERYLTIYQADVREVNEQIKKIEKNWPSLELSGGEASLQALIDKKIEDMNQAAWERDKRDLNHALQIFLTGRWQKLSEEIQKNIDAIQAQQKAILGGQLGKKTVTVHKTVWSIALAVGSGLLLFLIAALVIRQDIVRRMEYEHQLEKAKSQALLTSEFKTQFLANMSHEIRTPMNGIMGMATVLLETPLAEGQKKYASIIKKSCEALLRIINDILDFSKVEAGKLALCVEQFELGGLLGDIEALFSTTIKQKKIVLHFQYDPRIPKFMIGDSGRLRQILNNLIGNAIKFTEQGSVTVVPMMLDKTSKLCKMRFEITDSGIGIPVEHQGKIFGAFQQADASTGKRYGGTGLGLSISKKIVELMGGTIGFKSEMGKGSTFWFELCLRVAEEFSEVAEDRSPVLINHQLTATSLNPLKALVAEDDPVNQEVIKVYLETMGVTPYLVNNGQEAIKKYVDNKYDVILLDLNMPLRSGLEVLEYVRKTEMNRGVKAAPVFIVTASVDGGALAQVNRLRGTGLIYKPLKFEEFKAMVQESLIQSPVALTPGVVHAEPSVVATEPTAVPDVAPAKAVPVNSSVANDDLKKTSLLIADDSEVNQDLLRIFLGAENFNLDFAFNGKVAFDLFKENTYDLVLMDVQMPIMNGLEATKKIRSWEKARGQNRVPILAFTAGVTEREILECRESGCDDYVSKPIEKEKFLTAVRVHANKTWQARANSA